MIWLAILSIINSTTGKELVCKISISTFSLIGQSMNRPKFCSYATWNSTAITLANSSTVGFNPDTVFVTVNNSIYVAETTNNRVQMWLEGNNNPIRQIGSDLTLPHGLFVTINGDLYIDSGHSQKKVNKWTWNASSNTTVMYTDSACCSLFIDTNDTLYCSMCALNQVIKMSLTDGTNITIVAAGNGTSGLSPTMLSLPHGVLVDEDFNVYVADTNNSRIQMFPTGQLNGITIVGNGAPNTITLTYPTGIVFDAAGYLFVADAGGNRIVGSGPDGFRCIVGCTSVNGSAADQLNVPCSLSFDSYGNLFVTDKINARIQKFLLATNSCCESCIV